MFPGYLELRRVRIGRVTALVAIAGGAYYLSWRATKLPELGPFAWGFFLAEVATYLTLASAVPLMWSPRPRRWAPPPQGTLDVYITVCGEPVEMVEATLQAALDIDYHHTTYILNDGRIARAEGWEEIEALAHRYGVTCFTRTEGARGKAGNLNHALRHTDGEFVAVIDADHLARPDLADDLLGHFHPRVAFVATRQDFRIDARDRLGNFEVMFYGVIQPAKDADNAAFSCGNGVVYRRAAIEDIGGFSEWNLVEDMHTSFQLHARGWQSVYVPRPVTTGTAPATAAEMAAQRLRWATDSLRLFFWDNPFRKQGLTVRQKLHYAQTTGVYYLTTAFAVAFLISPALSLLLNVQVIGDVTSAAYIGHLLAYLVPLVGMLVAFAGFRGALRLLQMQSFLAPVFTLAAFRALKMRPGARKRKAFSGVTKKSRQATVNRITLVQHGLFALLITAVFVELAQSEGIQWEAVFWALLMAGSLCTQNSMLSMNWEVAQSARIAFTAPVVVVGLLAIIAVWAPFPGLESVSAQTPAASARAPAAVAKAPAPPPPPRRRLVEPRRGAYLGVYSGDLVFAKHKGLSLRRYAGAKPRIVHRFQQWWGGGREFDLDWAHQVADAGAVPMVTWEPWRKPKGSVVDGDQHPGLLGDIAAGRYDRYIRRYARRAAAYRKPFVVRLMHEMNGGWYPWTAIGNGNTPADYKAAYRHVHRVFDAADATNVSWVFSVDSLAGADPTAVSDLMEYYPGARYVDWTGLSGFNWGPESVYPSERSFLSTFSGSVAILEQLGKPVMLAEIGTSDKSRDPAGWVEQALTGVKQLPAVKAVVWFDSDTPDAAFGLRREALDSLRANGARPGLTPRLQTRAVRG